ncbi:MAG: hypothetical protein AB3N17_01635 [Tateyamaria sp.]
MTHPTEPQDPDWVDHLLDDLAATPVPDPSADLMARVLSDAETHMPPPGGVVARVPWWRQVVGGIGGWTSVGGLVAATVTGLAIGLGAFDSAGLDAVWTLGYGSYYDSELGLDAFGWALEEG